MSKFNWCKYLPITKNKGIEIQLTDWRNKNEKGYVTYPHRFHLSLQWCHPRHFDHPDIAFHIEILGIYFHVKFVDNRHQEDMDD